MKRYVILLLLLWQSLFAQVQLLVKVESRSLKKNLAAENRTGVAAVDHVLQQSQAQSLKPLFIDFPDRELDQWITLTVSENQADAVIEQLQQQSSIQAVTRNRAFKLDFVPNDSRLDEQWALEHVQAYDAWDIERGSSDVLVAIIDTGVDYAHPDLLENIWINPDEDLNSNGIVDEADFNGVDEDGNGYIDDVQGWDFTDAPNYPDGSDYLQRDNDPMDEFGHGTGAAGLVAAVADNNLGVAGLAHGCRIMNLRAFNGSGYGEEDDVASAILYAIENGASVINMSFGDVFVSRVIEDVVQYGVERGVLMVASAGNSGDDFIHYPSGFQGVMSIGSTDNQNQRSSFSNYGPTVDLFAPGSAVLSTTLDEAYKNWNGTSFAAPYTAAAAALLFSHYPDLSAEAVRGILVNSADFFSGADQWTTAYSHGLLNVYNALTAPRESVVRLKLPALDAGYSEPLITIVGSAWTPDFQSFSIFYGEGNNPDHWQPVFVDQTVPVIQDTLFIWQPSLSDGEYTLRLQVENRNGESEHVSTRFFMDATPPQISNTRVLPMYDGPAPAALVEFETDDLSTGTLFFRPENSNDPFDMMLENYRTVEPRILFTQNDGFGVFDLYVSAKNGAGLVSTDRDQGDYYQADLSAAQIPMNTFIANDLQLPFGRMLHASTDFDQNGIAEVVLSHSDNGAIGTVGVYEYRDGEMQMLFQTENNLIPRDVGDADGDGKQELLTGYGFSSWLYECPAVGDFPSQLIQEWVGDGAAQYWAAKIADTDKDGKGEIIMRVIHSDGGSTDQFEIFETTGDNQFEVSAILPNFTDGDNFYGVPHVETGDFDDDGKIEILIGDSDGDIFIYENSGDDQFIATWQTRLPLLDAIDYIVTGDFDGDGEPEFAAGSHSDPNLNTEHNYDARHWHFQVFDRVADDQYSVQAECRFFGFESPSDFASSINAGDVDNDGADELLISVYPDFYLLDFQESKYKLAFYAESMQNHGIAVADFNSDGRNEFWLGDGESIFGYLAAGSSSAPPAPANITAQPLSDKVILSWLPVEGAEAYLVYRAQGDAADMQKIAETTEATFEDVDVQQDNIYYYIVFAYDPAADPNQSIASRTVSARPGAQPRLVNAIAESDKTIRLYFDKPLNSSLKRVQNYILDVKSMPTSVAVFASGQQALLTFSELAAGAHEIRCQNLFDSNNVPMHEDFDSLHVNVPVFPSAFYVVSGEFINDQSVQIQFSEKVETVSAENLENYSIDKWNVLSASASSDKAFLSVLADGAQNDKHISVRIKNVQSKDGVRIVTGRGDVISIPVNATDNVDNITVYPNPWLPVSGTSFVHFTALDKDDQVRIFTVSGSLVAKLNIDSDGTARWNLNAEKDIAPGIYIYHIKKLKKSGKIAVIR